MKIRGLAELLRISLAPTVVADLCAGVGLARGGPGGLDLVARMAGVSLLLFCGGMALNGWVDREADRVTRPQRPIPSGAVSPGAALAFAIAALAAAPVLAWFAGGAHRGATAAWTAGVAAAIALYHTPVKESSLGGPLLLGAIRAGDLLLGAVAAAGIAPGVAAAWPVAAAYGVYVLGASCVAHEEDRAPRMRLVRAGVVLAFAAIAANGAISAWRAQTVFGGRISLIVVLVALYHAFGTRAALRLLRADAPGKVPLSAYARLLLARMPWIAAAAAFGAGAGDLGLVALLTTLVVYALVRVVPPT